MDSIRGKQYGRISCRKNDVGNVLVDATAKVADSAVLGPNVVVGPGVEVGEGARIKNSILYAGSKVGASAWLDHTIVGWKSTVGRWARIEGLSCLGEDVHVKEEVFLNSVIVLPNKTIAENVLEKGKILM